MHNPYSKRYCWNQLQTNSIIQSLSSVQFFSRFLFSAFAVLQLLIFDGLNLNTLLSTTFSCKSLQICDHEKYQRLAVKLKRTQLFSLLKYNQEKK